MDATIRKHAADGIEKGSKKAKIEHDDELLNRFLQWCTDNALSISKKVRVTKENSSAHYGMFAVQDIDKGECLFEIPRNLLLNPENSEIVDKINADPDIHKSKSGWVPVLISLMYEYHQPASKWRPYLDLVPNFEDLELPLFWEESEFSELCGTGVKEAVDCDKANVAAEFKEFVIPFVSKHTDLFPKVCQDLEFYKKMVAFVMAYSFTEPADEEDSDDEEDKKNLPMMVPVADILNHIAKNNANLSFGIKSLKMVSTRVISKGEEVFNTYGQLSNSSLLHMYGFAEPFPNNHFDTVDMPMSLLHEAVKEEGLLPEINLFEKKWQFLEKSGILSDDGSFVLGVEGILTEEELHTVLKIFSMTDEEFRDYEANEGWADASSDDGAEESLSFESIAKLTLQRKKLIARFAKLCLSKYATDIETDRQFLESQGFHQLSKRKQMCLHVRYGQKKLLEKLFKSCQT